MNHFVLLSRRYKCIGVIDRTRKSSFLVYSSFNQVSRIQIPAGSQGIVNLFGAGMPCEYYWYSKWGGCPSVCYNLVAVVVPRIS